MNRYELEAMQATARLEAYNLGVAAARAAASWATDGNTSAEHYARILRMFDDGDPEVSDYLPAPPDLSGEWADFPTPYKLADDLLPIDVDEITPELVDAVALAWEDGVSETFEAACEANIRRAL